MRPIVMPAPLWDLLVLLGSVAGALLLVAAVPALAGIADRVRRRDASGLDLVTGLLGLTVVGYAAAYGLAVLTGLRRRDPADEEVPRTIGLENPTSLLVYAVLGAAAALVSIAFIIPTNPGGVPWDPSFDLKLVQYAPVAIVIVIGGAMLWWVLSARKWFTGPVSDVETPLDPHLLKD